MNDGIDILLNIYLGIWVLIASLTIWFFYIRKWFKKPIVKYRVGKKQGRAILEVETGKEYLIFPTGKEDLAKCFCEWLNTSVYRETAMKRQVLALLVSHLKNATREVNQAKTKDVKMNTTGGQVSKLN